MENPGGWESLAGIDLDTRGFSLLTLRPYHLYVYGFSSAPSAITSTQNAAGVISVCKIVNNNKLKKCF